MLFKFICMSVCLIGKSVSIAFCFVFILFFYSFRTKTLFRLHLTIIVHKFRQRIS